MLQKLRPNLSTCLHHCPQLNLVKLYRLINVENEPQTKASTINKSYTQKMVLKLPTVNCEELTDVLTDIFNTSLNQAVVQTCLKATANIPVPKKPCIELCILYIVYCNFLY